MASAFSGARYLIFALTLYLLPPGAPLTANDRHFLEIQIEPHRHDRLGDSQGVLYFQSSEKLARYGSSALSGAEQLTVLVGKESVALASYFSLEAKLPTAG
jgi:hypothetical protein